MSSYDRFDRVKRLRVRDYSGSVLRDIEGLGSDILRAAAFTGKEIREKEAAESGLSVVSRIVLGICGS